MQYYSIKFIFIYRDDDSFFIYYIMLFIFLSGTPMYGVMIYQTLLVLATAFTHANISLPKGLDKAISYILVSPLQLFSCLR